MLKKILSVIVIFLLHTSLVSVETDKPSVNLRTGKDHALFFVVENYSNWSPLRFPIDDAEEIASILETDYNFSTRIIRNPTWSQIDRVLKEYINKNYVSDGQLLVWFGGHGDFDAILEEGYFIPRDGSGQTSEKWFSFLRLQNYLSRIDCQHILLSIDACYAGTFDQAVATRGDKPKFGRPTRGLDERDLYIQRELQLRTRLFIASGKKEKVPDRSDFATYFKHALQYKAGNDGILSFKELDAELDKSRPKPHVAEFKGNQSESNFLFIGQRPVPKSLPAPVNNQEETLWQFTQQQNTAPAYRFYISSFPEGRYKSIAEKRLKTPPDDLVFIQGGTFTMGCTSEQGDECEDDEKPAHQVTVDDFYLARTEVSRGEFRAFVTETEYVTTAEKKGTAYGLKDGKWGYHPGLDWEDMGFIQTDDHPVIGVSWYDAVAFCNWKSKQEGLQPSYQINGETVNCNWNANGYRLPTEAEWEFAARSRGRAYKYAWGSKSPNGNVVDEAAKGEYSNWTVWEDYNDGYVYTAPVGKFEQGDLGLADMTGNVWEWCWDWYDSDYYTNSPQRNPRGADSGSYRVVRGGSWGFVPASQRVANRVNDTPSSRRRDIGFRILRAAG